MQQVAQAEPGKSRWVGGGLIAGLTLIVAISITASLRTAPFIEPDQVAAVGKQAFLLSAGETIGQTFTVHHAGLQSIDIFLKSQTNSDGQLRLHVRSDPQSPVDLATAQLQVAIIQRPDFYRFAFPALSDSRQKDYYLLLELVGPGTVQVGGAPATSYLDGSAYRDGVPQDGQITFRTSFARIPMIAGFAGPTFTWVGFTLIGVFLYVLPGWALLAILGTSLPQRSWAEQLGLSAGVSLAIYPILLLWTNLIGLLLGPLYAWLPGCAALAWLVWSLRAYGWARMSAAWHTWWRSAARYPDLVLMLVIGLVFGVRFLAIGSLDVPMWGDSYQHTLIAQLIVDNRGLFDSWQPYADIQTFTYHFGFHTAVALLHWVSGAALPEATLWTGQILNGLAVVAIYPLTIRVSGNRWAGVVAVLLAGLLVPMPMYYINWGRYTQLAGQTILPAAICLIWIALEARARDWKLLGLTWILVCGLALSHYRILIFIAFFFVAFLVIEVRRGGLRSWVFNSGLIAAGAGLMYLPWLVHVFAGKILSNMANRVTSAQVSASAATQEYNAIGDLTTYLPTLVWLVLPICIGWALWRGRRGVAVLSLWWFLVLLAANPQWFDLPGAGTLTNFAVFIAIYIPVGVLIGESFGQLIAIQRQLIGTGAVVLVVLLAIWGVGQRLDDLHVAQSALVTRPDLRAATWIQDHLPQDARFLVNSFFAYGGTSIVGSDGGWWLPLLAHRQTMLPPLNYSAEQGPRPDYHEWVNALSAAVLKQGIEHPAVLQLLNERGITHVYIGQRQGRVNYERPTLQPQQLLESVHFRVVYHQERVWIFKIIP